MYQSCISWFVLLTASKSPTYCVLRPTQLPMLVGTNNNSLPSVGYRMKANCSWLGWWYLHCILAYDYIIVFLCSNNI